MRSARLVLHPDTPQERAIPLQPGTNRIGRTPDNDIVINDSRLSRRHACVQVDEVGARVSDAGSRNGTWLNGLRVDAPLELGSGDVIGCGDVLLLFLAEDAVQPTAVHIISDSDPGSITLSEIRAVAPDVQDHRRMEVLLTVSRILSSPAVIEDQLRRIVDLLAEIVGAQRAAVLLLETDSDTLTTAAAYPEGTSGDRISRTICEWVRDERVAALFSDAAGDARLADARSVQIQSIRSSMCAPMLVRDQLLGVVYVDHRSEADRFDTEDLEFLGAFASQAAIAIENARLVEQLQHETRLRSNLERFFPPKAIRRMQAAESIELKAVETVVTALFADISSFTQISATLPPLQVVELLNDIFPVMSEIVFLHEGTLEKYIGDAILAVWGAPFGDVDDADRAVAAALQMQHAVTDLDRRWSPRLGRSLQLHIGLCTGPVAAGNVGSGRYLQYATIGDTTNVASRVCDAAGAGEVLIAESTQTALTRAANLEALPPRILKGKTEPTLLFRVSAG